MRLPASLWVITMLAAATGPGHAEGVPPHPRVLFTAADQQRTEALAATDARLRDLIAANHERADALITAPTVVYHIPDGKRLLAQSRSALRVVTTCALAARLGDDPRHTERAIRDMLAAAAFQDWNPSHFLDTAEMTAALAIGYDWLHHRLDDTQRQTIRAAIVRHGLRPGLAAYETRAWWTKAHNNWNQVCNGGLVLGALALHDEEPELAAQILAAARASIPAGLRAYAPDGAYPEGPMYWVYGSSYTALTCAALRAALGDDGGIAAAEGLDRSAAYVAHMIGPTGLAFNYADSGDAYAPAPALGYFAGLYDQPALLAWHTAGLDRWRAAGRPRDDRLDACDIIWYRPPPAPGTAPALPLAARFRGVQDVAAMRSAWADPAALYVGFKGGDNTANHGHLDIGSFVFDAGGVRWAVDLGSDDYNLPGYFGRERWSYYRLNTLSHNTLTIGGGSQEPKGVARIEHFHAGPERAEAIADLTKAYAGAAASVRRGVALVGDRGLLVQDEFAGCSGPVRWAMVTRAAVSVAGAEATLVQGKQTLRATILAPAGAAFAVLPTTPPTPREKQNAGTAMLAVTLDGPTRLAVWLRLATAAAPAPPVVPLADWECARAR